MRYLLIFFTLLALTGCSARGWYDAIQQTASRDCNKYPYDSSEYEKCVESTDISYDQYQNEITKDKKSPDKKQE